MTSRFSKQVFDENVVFEEIQDECELLKTARMRARANGCSITNSIALFPRKIQSPLDLHTDEEIDHILWLINSVAESVLSE